MKRGNASLLLTTASLLFANILYAAAVVYLIEPSGIITGGATGIALFLNHCNGWSVSGVLLAINIVMFFTGWIFLGGKFARGTAVSSLLIPIAIEFFTRVSGGFVLTKDLFLCTVLGGLAIGVSLGLVMRAGYSTGGMDIPPLMLHRYLRLPVSVGMWGLDVAILLLQAFLAGRDEILYGIVMVIVYSFVIDRVMLIGTNRMQVQVISAHANAIRDAILSNVDRGVTMLHACTGYLEKETDIVMTILSARELRRVEQMIHRIDPQAFLIVVRAGTVTGRGFSTEKEYLSGIGKEQNGTEIEKIDSDN